MNFSLSIAARLKEERSRLKLSQEKLASIAGITRQTQSKYEKAPDSLIPSTFMPLPSLNSTSTIS